MTTSVHVAGPFNERVTLLDTAASVALRLNHPSLLCHLSRAFAQGHCYHYFSDGRIQRFKGVCVLSTVCVCVLLSVLVSVGG